MNQTSFPLAGPAPSGLADAGTLDAVQARFGRQIAARMSEQSGQIAPDIAERLRFAREQALERGREARRFSAVSAAGASSMGTTRGGAAILGRTGPAGWWLRAGSVMPAFALAAGLFLIQHAQDDAQITTAAAVDAALLADDLPPQAYSDAGFAEFLKSSSASE